MIAETGFAAAADDIRAHCEPCLHIFEAGRASGGARGGTRFGGDPDLPRGASWPQSPSCPQPSFFGQIDLAEIRHSPIAKHLPQTGLLSFFADLESFDQDPLGVYVLHIPAGNELEQLSAPEGTASYNPVAVRFEPGVAFTEFDWAWLNELADANPNGDIDALTNRLGAAPWPVMGRLLGYANWPQDDLREELYFREIGRPGQERLRIWRSWPDWEKAKKIADPLANGTIYRPWSEQDDANVRWIIDHAAEVDRGVTRWQSLLTIESGKAMNLWINDANAIYFFAPKDLLQHGDFSNVQAVTTQN
ncbi:DUF1963 domain-containing protein [Novosphingobium sp. B 225]|uniref:DUF1963 domain-containing protein n=1 Tax=Novosphingobium sp. B 225 TaxID=1961849 RepID=UPI001595FFCF|nr:DUF1963 domain-containing protein [Novosphingobium sp. B 225]